MPEMQQLSQKAYDRLVAELQDLTTRGRIDIARKIEAARELGDLSENGDYHAAKEEKGKMEGRIMHIESVLENCEIIEFSEENKILRINVIDENFNGSEELYRNLKNEYTLEVIVKKEIVTLEEIKSLYKKELIDQEMETEEFKKVLAKFPNAKIIDIEEIERGDDNDG